MLSGLGARKAVHIAQRRRRRASRAPVTVEDAVGGAERDRSAFARSGRAGRHGSMYNKADWTPGHGPLELTGEARARSGPLARQLLRGGEGQPSKCGQLRTRSGMSTTSPARLIALLTPRRLMRVHTSSARHFDAWHDQTPCTESRSESRSRSCCTRPLLLKTDCATCARCGTRPVPACGPD